MGSTTIEWCDKVWNPVTGCTKVSQGCKHCYAERIFHRPYPGRAFTDVRCHPARIEAPLRWRKPSRVFVNSMGDLFHEAVPDQFIERVMTTIFYARQHTFQVLTKRPARMRDWSLAQGTLATGSTWPPANLWLGVSVEDQATADERIPLLLQTPAAVRWISAEPLLGPIRLDHMDVEAAGHKEWCQIDALTGHHTDMARPCADVPHLDWIIVGGESGPKARPFNVDWARSTIEQCRAAGIACFVKQLGAHPAGPINDPRHTGIKGDDKLMVYDGDIHARYHFKDRAGADPAEWPADLRIRAFPK